MERLRVTRLLLGCGAVGAVLFVVVFTVDGATRAGYDPVRHPVSALSLGDRGWLQITNFVVSGLLLLAFAVGLRRATRPGPGSRWGPLLVGTYAVALALSGPFVMDPIEGYPPGTPAPGDADPSWHHTVHDVAGVVVFVALPVAGFVLARWFAARRRPGWAVYSVVSGALGVALLGAFGTAYESGHAAAGLVQRAMIVAGWSWVTLVALRLLADHRQPPVPR